MTTPTLYADGESANSFFTAPSGQGDGPRLVTRTVTVADSASSGTVYGVIPFNKGAQVSFGSGTLIVPTALDTATLMTLIAGWSYEDVDTVSSIEDDNGFITSEATAPRAGGVVSFNAVAGATFSAGSDGWITVTTGGGSVTTAGTIVVSAIISYQS